VSVPLGVGSVVFVGFWCLWKLLLSHPFKIQFCCVKSCRSYSRVKRTEVTVVGETLVTHALVRPLGGALAASTFPTSPTHAATDPEPPPPPPTNGSSPPSSLEQIEALEFHHRRRVRRPSTRGVHPPPLRLMLAGFGLQGGRSRAPLLELLGGDVARSTGHAAGGKQPPSSPIITGKGKVPQVAQGVGSSLAPKPARVATPFGQERRRSSFMAPARHASRHLQAMIDKPLPEPDADGWHLVVQKNKTKRDAWSRTSLLPPRRKGKVPVDLIGLCFNCFSVQHIARHCPNPSCCLRCRVLGHLAQDCN
jgi:hypothetical protein